MLVISWMLNSTEPDVRAISHGDCHRNLGSVTELYCLQNNLEHVYNIYCTYQDIPILYKESRTIT